MANEVLQAIAQDISAINKQIKDARELITALREAGESVSELESDLQNLVIRKQKWERMLKSRGLTVSE